MVHLYVDLYDAVDDGIPSWILDDQQENNRKYFHDLNLRDAADKPARVRIRKGTEYQVGDHIRLLDEVRRSNTDTISIDPAVAADVDLNKVLHSDRHFADRAAAVLYVINPNPNNEGNFKLRVSLYDTVDQEFPTLILYDWEFPPSLGFADLNLFHFADKTARILVERGPNYKAGDRIILWDSMDKDRGRSLSLEPGDYDLNAYDFSDKVAVVVFDLQPPVL